MMLSTVLRCLRVTCTHATSLHVAVHLAAYCKRCQALVFQVLCRWVRSKGPHPEQTSTDDHGRWVARLDWAVVDTAQRCKTGSCLVSGHFQIPNLTLQKVASQLFSRSRCPAIRTSTMSSSLAEHIRQYLAPITIRSKSLSMLHSMMLRRSNFGRSKAKNITLLAGALCCCRTVAGGLISPTALTCFQRAS